eukprot:gb/GECG01005942.1/.p1 GENE.gb/GECG01005942.1/~~gb/GECG01005942.1/.p1  ORF type:complete len:120 (+),score=17.97 gb/GECG01005942.1/:1-360(+)
MEDNTEHHPQEDQNNGAEGGHDELVVNEDELPVPTIREKSCTMTTITVECDRVDHPEVVYKFMLMKPPYGFFGTGTVAEEKNTNNASKYARVLANQSLDTDRTLSSSSRVDVHGPYSID